MDTTQSEGTRTTAPPAAGPAWGKIVLLVLAVAAITSVATVWMAMHYLFPKAFTPVELSAREEQALNAKLERLGWDKPEATARQPGQTPQSQTRKADDGRSAAAPLSPERYSEEGASREIVFSERELNGLLARNTDLAPRLAIDLSPDLASAKLLVPLDPDFPLLGGKTLKVTAGLELRFAGQKPVVALRGISIWGVPLPNAWLGGIKNVDLIGEFGADQGFWHAFAAGIEHIQVGDGRLSIKLKE